MPPTVTNSRPKDGLPIAGVALNDSWCWADFEGAAASAVDTGWRTVASRSDTHDVRLGHLSADLVGLRTRPDRLATDGRPAPMGMDVGVGPHDLRRVGEILRERLEFSVDRGGTMDRLALGDSRVSATATTFGVTPTSGVAIAHSLQRVGPRSGQMYIPTPHPESLCACTGAATRHAWLHRVGLGHEEPRKEQTNQYNTIIKYDRTEDFT